MDLRTQESKGRYFLVAKDVFSHRFFVEPVSNKSAQQAVAAFKRMLDKLKPPHSVPLSVQVDAGTEFLGPFRRFLRKRNIHLVHARGVSKARMAERAIRSLKRVIIPFIESNPRHSWAEVLEQVANSLNKRYDRSIGMSPDDVVQRWREVQARNMARDVQLPFKEYSARQKELQRGGAVKEGGFEWRIGDAVYVPHARLALEKESDRQFRFQIYYIAHILTERRPYLFRLRDEHGKKVPRLYYAVELRKVTKRPETFPVQKILARKTVRGRRMLKVRWLDHGPSFDEWISAKQLTV